MRSGLSVLAATHSTCRRTVLGKAMTRDTSDFECSIVLMVHCSTIPIDEIAR